MAGTILALPDKLHTAHCHYDAITMYLQVGMARTVLGLPDKFDTAHANPNPRWAWQARSFVFSTSWTRCYGITM